MAETNSPVFGYPTSPAWSMDGRYIAFLYVENNNIKVRLGNPSDFSLWQLDEFTSDDILGQLKWENSEMEDVMLLNYVDLNGMVSRSYNISKSIITTPPGTPIP